jgi:dGTP triphosphohydrolase
LDTQVSFRKARLPARLHDLVDLCFTDPGSQRAYPTDDKKYTRGVVDFIASLTELQAYELHRRLGGSPDHVSTGGWPII